MSNPNIPGILPLSAQTAQHIAKDVAANLAKSVASEESLDNLYEPSLFNPMMQAQKFKELEKLKTQTQEKQNIDDPEEVQILDVEEVDQTASRFQKNNPELSARTLSILRDLIKEDDTPEDILRKVLGVYPDPSLADEALEFLIETAQAALADNLKQAKAQLNDTYGRQVRAGRNIGSLSREFAEKGLGSATKLRDMYRDVTGNPRGPLQLFDELANKYPYNQLKTIVLFLLHSLGVDLKSKGPSIDPAELIRLITETRSLQGILGVFRFFQSRMSLIKQQFRLKDLLLPEKVTFESLAKMFIKLLAERYVNPEKIMQTAIALGLSEETAAQIIIYAQMQDAIKQIAPKYYRNPQHRNELRKAFIDTLEELEDKEEEEKKKKK